MWPMLLDYTEDDCQRMLRKFELEAYASIISAFRAQGEFSKEKRKILQDLSSVLCISMDRHKAEIRRAVNDEQLNTIAERLFGANTVTDWSIEGRRVVPLMPRLVPETDFTILANFKADIEAARNSELSLPETTRNNLDLKHVVNGDDEEVKLKRSLKRSLSPESSGNSEKIFALDSAAVSTTSAENMDEDISDIPTHSNSPVPSCILQSVMGNDNAVSKLNSTPVTKSTIVPLTKVIVSSTSSTTIQSTAVQKTTSSFVSKVTAAVSLPSVSIPPGKSNFTNVIPHVPASDGELLTGASTTGDTTTSSVLTFLTTAASTQSSTLPTTSAAPQSRSKVILTSKPVMRKTLSTLSMGSIFSTPTPTTHQPNIGVLQKAVPSHNLNTPRASSPIISSTPLQCQIPNTINRAQSPVGIITRAVTPTTITNQAPAPILLKQATVALPNKTTVVPKVITKPAPIRAPGPRAVVASITKPPPIHKCSTSVAATTAPVRQSIPLTVKATLPSQMITTTTKNTSAITYSSKILPSPCQVRPLVQPMTKAIRYRNDGGLKIISQSMPVNRLLPKPGVPLVNFTSPTVMSGSNVVTATSGTAKIITSATSSTVTGTARIVNFTQPVARFARALPPTSLATVSLVNSLPVSGLRVAVPLTSNNTSIVRGAIPAKPNVIVVHKAQVWPQAPGATIVMTSSGALSRLSSDVFEEAVSLMQRQEAGKQSGSIATFKAVTLQQGTAQPSSTQSIKVNQTVIPKTCSEAVQPTTTITTVPSTITSTVASTSSDNVKQTTSKEDSKIDTTVTTKDKDSSVDESKSTDSGTETEPSKSTESSDDLPNIVDLIAPDNYDDTLDDLKLIRRNMSGSGSEEDEGDVKEDTKTSVEKIVPDAAATKDLPEHKPEEESSTKDGQNSKKDEENSTKDGESSTKDDENSKDEESSVKDDESSVKDDESSVKDDENSMDEYSSNDEEDSVKDDGSSVKDDEGSMEDENSIKDEETSFKDDSSVRDEETSIKDDSSVKDEETSIKDDGSDRDEETSIKDDSSVKDEEMSLKDEENDVKNKEEEPDEDDDDIEEFNLEDEDEKELHELDDDDDDDSVELLSPEEQSSDGIELLQETGPKRGRSEESREEKLGSSEVSNTNVIDLDSEQNYANSSIEILNDMKIDSSDSFDAAPTQLGHLNIDEPCDTQTPNDGDAAKAELDPFLKSDAESQSSRDIFLHAGDSSSDAEASNEVPQSNHEINSLQAVESLGDSPASSQSPPGALVNNNEDAEMDDLDSDSLNLNLSPDSEDQ